MTGYIFVDDGYPEADEYDNNYLAYDPADWESVRSALRKAQVASPSDRQEGRRNGFAATLDAFRRLRLVKGT